MVFYMLEHLFSLIFILLSPILIVYFIGRSPNKTTIYKLKWLRTIIKELEEKGLIDSKISDYVQNDYIEQKISEKSVKQKNLLSVFAIIFITIGILAVFLIEWGGMTAEKVKAVTAVALSVFAIFISYLYKDKEGFNQKVVRLAAFLGTTFSGIAMILFSRSFTCDYTWGVTFLIYAVISLCVLTFMRNIENWIILAIVSVLWLFMDYNTTRILAVTLPVCLILLGWSLVKKRKIGLIASLFICNILILSLASNNTYNVGQEWFKSYVLYIFPVFMLVGCAAGIYLQSVTASFMSLIPICIWYSYRIDSLPYGLRGQMFFITILLLIVNLFYIFQYIDNRNSKQLFTKSMKAATIFTFIVMTFILTKFILPEIINGGYTLTFDELMFPDLSKVDCQIPSLILVLILSSLTFFILNVVKYYRYKFLQIENYLILCVSAIFIFALIGNDIVQAAPLLSTVLLNICLFLMGLWLIIFGKALNSRYNTVLGIAVITINAAILINKFAGLFAAISVLFITTGVVLFSFTRNGKLNANSGNLALREEDCYENQ